LCRLPGDADTQHRGSDCNHKASSKRPAKTEAFRHYPGRKGAKETARCYTTANQPKTTLIQTKAQQIDIEEKKKIENPKLKKIAAQKCGQD
jgi:hypothetical protein